MPDGFSPTTEQADIIKFEPSGHLLVRGEAGSGKTTVLVLRAGHLQRNEMFEGRLLFLTYNVALAKYVQLLLERHKCAESVTVSTVHKWASDFYRAANGEGPRLATGGERRTVLLAA